MGIISYQIQGKEGGIQLLAGLAPSSQTVVFIIEDPGATKGGSCRLLMKMSVDQLTPSTVNVNQMGCQSKWHRSIDTAPAFLCLVELRLSILLTPISLLLLLQLESLH